MFVIRELYSITLQSVSITPQLNSDISNVNDALANTDTKLQLSNIKTLSLNWKDGVLEFYVDGTRIFGINARWNGGTI